jgi:hypothetical protein
MRNLVQPVDGTIHRASLPHPGSSALQVTHTRQRHPTAQEGQSQLARWPAGLHGGDKLFLYHPSHHLGCTPDCLSVLAGSGDRETGRGDQGEGAGARTWAPVVAILLGLATSGLYSGAKKVGKG